MNNSNVILYDGYCNLCDYTVKTLLKIDKKGSLLFSSLDSKYSRDILKQNDFDPNSIDTFCLVCDGSIFVRSAAVLKLVSILGYPWKIFKVFSLLPLSFLDKFYSIISKNRYRWFGKKTNCIVPTPESRKRFIE